MTLYNDSKELYSFAQANGRVIKLCKLIQLDEDGLRRPDGFLNRHVKIKARLIKLYAELKEAQQSFHDEYGL